MCYCAAPEHNSLTKEPKPCVAVNKVKAQIKTEFACNLSGIIAYQRFI